MYKSRRSSKSLAGKCGQDKRRLVDLLAVVLAKLLLFLGRPAAQRLLEVKFGVLAADHEADLAGRVGGDGGVAIFDVGEDLLARLLQVDNEWHVEPLVLGFGSS